LPELKKRSPVTYPFSARPFSDSRTRSAVCSRCASSAPDRNAEMALSIQFIGVSDRPCMHSKTSTPASGSCLIAKVVTNASRPMDFGG